MVISTLGGTHSALLLHAPPEQRQRFVTYLRFFYDLLVKWEFQCAPCLGIVVRYDTYVYVPCTVGKSKILDEPSLAMRPKNPYFPIVHAVGCSAAVINVHWRNVTVHIGVVRHAVVDRNNELLDRSTQ